jgi:hypothetical protein
VREISSLLFMERIESDMGMVNSGYFKFSCCMKSHIRSRLLDPNSKAHDDQVTCLKKKLCSAKQI